jgi:hypothetical protein
MNEQISLAYSLQPDGSSSIAFSISVIDGSGESKNINTSSLSGNAIDLKFIASINEAIGAYREEKGI